MVLTVAILTERENTNPVCEKEPLLLIIRCGSKGWEELLLLGVFLVGLLVAALS